MYHALHHFYLRDGLNDTAVGIQVEFIQVEFDEERAALQDPDEQQCRLQ